MSFDSDRFVSDKAYATGKTMFVGVVALTLLAAFLATKIITEVIEWNKADNVYPTNVISVFGEGEVVAVPDVAEFSFSVNERGDSVEAAQGVATGKINAAIDFLKGKGIEEKDIETTGYNAYPRYQYTTCTGTVCVNEQTLIGYEVSQNVSVTVRDTSKAGELLSGVGSTGISNISGLSFKIDDMEKYKQEARMIAIEKAKDQAKDLAKGLDVKLKGIINFSEDSGYYGYGGMNAVPEMSVRQMSADMAASPQLPSGEEKVRTKVYITYEFK